MDDPSTLSEGSAYRPIEGMESVVATVSGYHGTERFKLIKLIAHAGANYVGAMTKSTTHLVCWRFEGKKYNLAKNIGAHIISHRWFEDCLKERKRLPEDSYSMQSGQDTGSITWEEPAFLNASGEGKCSIPTNRRSKAVDVGASYLDWPESNVLSRHSESSHFPNLHLSSNRRNLFDDNQDDITYGSASRSHCLKKKSYCDLSNYIDPSQKQGTCSKKSRTQLADSDSISGNSLRNRLEQDGLEEILLDNKFRDLNSSLDNRLSSDNEHHEERIETLDSFNDGMKDNEPHKENESLIQHGQNQAEVSCVICWTEFSTTRAVLPCGHRFCYTCIQGWADCMASNGKPSTCPLCKASFTNIKKMEDSSTDQKIYSQTIPSGSPNRDIRKRSSEGNDKDTNLPADYICYECRYHEPVDLLVCCQICKAKWIHSCCLNPLSIPWTCIHCRDLRTLYRLFR
ncbi:uncharacterized protein LOC122015189 [Zingiber officinale]|uniref:uncharacterized protein LOC122015189 n=1 Tax=Zingiber officinale TaxID=94328 RepID=UPI001C4C4680|nr:uncharacterized protein LOC122015189 [Zingiber officinale]